MVPGEGFEPPTFGLQNRCTTTVLTRRRGIVPHLVRDGIAFKYPEYRGRWRVFGVPPTSGLPILASAARHHARRSVAAVPVGVQPLFMARCRCSVIRWLSLIVMVTVL